MNLSRHFNQGHGSVRETTDRFWRNEENSLVYGSAFTHAQFASPLTNEIQSAILMRILNRQKRLRETQARVRHVLPPTRRTIKTCTVATLRWGRGQ